MNTPTTCLAAGAALLCLAGCSDPITDVTFEDWQPELAAPVLNTSFTLRDAIGQTEFADYVSEDARGALRVQISQPIFDLQPAATLELPTIVVPLLDSTTAFDLEELGVGVGLHEVQLEGGQLVVNFTNVLDEAVEVRVQSTSILPDGAPLDRSYTVAPSSTLADTSALIGSALDFGADLTLHVAYAARRPDGRPVVFPAGAVRIEAAEFVVARGTLEALEADLGRDTVDLSFLEAFEPGTVGLVDAALRIDFENEIAAPFTISTDTATALLRDGAELPFVSALVPGFDLDYPRAGETVAAASSLLIDRETSNLVDVVNQFPTGLVLDLVGLANRDSLAEVFEVRREARLRAHLAVDLPLALEFDGFELAQELDFDPSSLAEAETAGFVLHVDNEFGLTADVQVYFRGADGVVVDSLFDAYARVIDAAEVDDFGEAVAATRASTEVELTKAQIDRIAASAGAEVRVRLYSPSTGEGLTRLYYDNRISVKLGARVGVRPF